MKKRQKYKKLIMFGIMFIIWSVLVGVWAYIWNTYYSNMIIRPFGYKGNWLIYFVYGLIVFCFTALYGGYRVGYYKRGDIIFSNILSILIANSITYLQTCLVGRAIMNIIPFFLMTAVDIVIIWIWASTMHKAYLQMYPPHNMLIIYGENRSAESLIYKMGTRAEKYNICQAVSVKDEPLEKILQMALSYESVIICDVKSGIRNKILKFCFEHSVRTYLTPKISDVLIRGAEEINLFDTPLLLCRNHGLSAEQRFLKRAFDLALSFIAIVITSPIMLVTAIAIRAYDGGPAIFKQERCTIGGKIFNIYKFRSMIVDAEKDGKPRPCVDGDTRITPVGKFIRKTRLDELPQLFNIFMGDMSIVGPRPERIEHVEMYSEDIPEFHFRLKVKGGLTGYAQIIGLSLIHI